jgi:outer membrane receptor protein involved in Fe transport
VKPAQKLSYAICSILGVHGASTAMAIAACLTAARVSAADQSAPAAAGAAGSELTEITVTAQRRTENLQDVPIAIQAFTAETLQQLSIENFDDLIRYLPKVTVAGNGPGQNNI